MQKEDLSRLYDALLFNVAFLLIIWVLWLYELETGHALSQYGTRPRSVRGLIGIVSTPFLHGSLEHIRGNTLSFLSLSTFLIFFYREIAFKVIFWLYAISGVLLWIIANGGNHIGASGVIYGMAAFLFFSGIFRNDPRLLRVALAVAFLYGSIIWWVLPIDPNISWEGHLAGSIVGVALALIYRKRGPQRKVYNWELDEEDEDYSHIPWNTNLQQAEDGVETDEEDKKKGPDDSGPFQSNSSDGSGFSW